MRAEEQVLRATALTKSYAGVRALRNCSFDLRCGEVHALVGENGAGKTTLTRIITGTTSADGGQLQIFGQTIKKNDPKLSQSLGVATIHQQPQIFPDLSVAENIALSLEQRGNGIIVDWTQRNLQAKQL